MPISDSLARGLKDRYFSELQHGRIESVATMLEGLKIHSGRKKFGEWAEFAKNKLGENVIATYHGGSKRKQYFAFEMLNFLPDREFNNWMEKSVFGHKVVIREGSHGNNVTTSKYSVSEHAILRIFQRTNNESYINGYSQRKILEELTFIPLWSNYWITVFGGLTLSILPDDISISIPSKNGLFLANFSNKTQEVEVRTFVDDSLLTAEQKLIKDSLLLIGKFVDPSPLTFASDITIYLDQTIAYFKLMLSHLLIGNVNSNFILNNLVSRISNDAARLKLKSEIKRSIEIESKYINSEDVLYLTSHTQREFSNYCIKKFSSLS